LERALSMDGYEIRGEGSLETARLETGALDPAQELVELLLVLLLRHQTWHVPNQKLQLHGQNNVTQDLPLRRLSHFSEGLVN
jgi:hypothetical protein